MLNEKEKIILKKGSLMEQSGLLIDHFYDKTDDWILEARTYFRKVNPVIFASSTSHNTDYDSEKDKPSLHPEGEICTHCEGRGWNKKFEEDVKRYCHYCKGSGKLSHNQ